MTTPTGIEQRLSLEPISSDTFIARLGVESTTRNPTISQSGDRGVRQR